LPMKCIENGTVAWRSETHAMKASASP